MNELDDETEWCSGSYCTQEVGHEGDCWGDVALAEIRRLGREAPRLDVEAMIAGVESSLLDTYATLGSISPTSYRQWPTYLALLDLREVSDG